jgi:sugar phosphate isomerase/epimerase
MKNAILTIFIFCIIFPNTFAQERIVGNIHEKASVKFALNFYSFNDPLRNGSESLESVIDYAADAGYSAVDMTAYYFDGYPSVPTDDYLYRIKYHAFRQGVQICGTGVRNDFSLSDPVAREREKQLVKDWIVAASKLGASTLRIFSGNSLPEGANRDDLARRIAADIDECAEFAQRYGIMLAVQNHNDFLKTADDVITLFSFIKSPAVGLMLDIGSYRNDPYGEIARTIRYAITWQIKETVFINNKEVKTDLGRVMGIIRANGYRGCVPVEIIGSGNERQRSTAMLRELEKY